MAAIRPLCDQAYDYLKELIDNRELKPGVIYSETQIAKKINMSRTPIKDALVRLSQGKYIDIIPSKGFCLHEMSEKDIWDTCQMRTAIEGYCAIELLKQRHTASGQLTLRGLGKLMDELNEIKEQGGDVRFFREKDMLFHDQLVNYVDNETFVSLFNSHMHQIDTLAGESLLTPNRMQKTYDEHLDILHAIVDGDIAACYDAISKHMIQTAEINVNILRTRNTQ